MRVLRWQVHKNRYSQYICRDCRASGVKAVGAKSVRVFASKIPMVALGSVVALLVVLLLIVAAVLAGSVVSYANGGLIEALKDAVRSLNQLAR